MTQQRRTLFISDLHLDSTQPKITQLLIRFLEEQAPHADALYILGDFFEIWVGDDDPLPLYSDISSALLKLSKSGVPLYFMHGNRDFLLGKPFAAACGMKIIPDPTLIELYGQKILLLHGDSLCTDDHAHQIFRWFTQNKLFKFLFRLLPLAWRKTIAFAIRGKSKNRMSTLDQKIMDVNFRAVERVFKKYRTSLLIHGHTHLPAIHEHSVNQNLAKRIVLAAWHERGNVLCFYEDGTFELQYF